MAARNIFLQLFLSMALSLVAVSLVQASSQKTKLRLALLPIPDVLPFYVAEERGYFKEEGVDAKGLSVVSPVERDQLMQAGSVDGMVNEISGAAAFNRDGMAVQIVAIARAPEQKSPLFRILANAKSGIEGPEDLKNVAIGVSKNTIIEYITTRMLTEAGLAPEAIVFASVPVLPERFQLLLSGQLKAATLPDPLAAAAIRAGAKEIISDLSLAELSASVITFSRVAILEKENAIKGFMRAWDRAAADLNQNPEMYKELLEKKIRIPKNIKADFVIPPMARGGLPTKEQWDDVMEWMMTKKILGSPVSYELSVSRDFLP